jgi:hypothetical protein
MSGSSTSRKPGIPRAVIALKRETVCGTLFTPITSLGLSTPAETRLAICSGVTTRQDFANSVPDSGAQMGLGFVATTSVDQPFARARSQSEYVRPSEFSASELVTSQISDIAQRPIVP